MWVNRKEFEALNKEVAGLKANMVTLIKELSASKIIFNWKINGEAINNESNFPIVSRFKELLEHLGIEYKQTIETKDGGSKVESGYVKVKKAKK